MKFTDSHPEYWKEYTNLQHIKHELIRNYLNSWLPKLGRWSGRILYLDTHAGRGKHLMGDLGSPLVALETILNHAYRESHFGKCEIVLFFIEIDEQNVEALKKEIAAFGKLPKQVKIDVICDECYGACAELVEKLKEKNQNLAPSFIFVDPYGFKVPFAVLRDLMSFERVELFVNIIWRELSMAIAQGPEKPGMADALNYIFDGDSWRELVGLEFDRQAHECINLFRGLIGSKWVTYIRMLGQNKKTRYMLMHLTNHDTGRDVIKDCIWKVCPDGGYYARQTDDPRQELLIQPEPDLKPLQDWVVDTLEVRPMRWSALHEANRESMWRIQHLNEVVRSLRHDGIIDGRKHTGGFYPKTDPELFLL